MNAPVNLKTPRPLFVDEVDEVTECIDSGMDGSPSSDRGDAGRDERPLLTDVVDDVTEITDSADEEEAAGPADGPRPLFVDEVDSVVEFLDAALQDAPGHEASPSFQPAKTATALGDAHSPKLK
jgi:hypothetical protein